MASKIYETQFLLGAKVQASMGKSFGAVNKNFAMIQKQASMSQRSINGISGTLKKMAGAAAAYFSFRTIGQAMIDNAADLQSYRNTLNVVMKDQKLAAKTMQWAANYANITPFDTAAVVEATVKLQSYGITAKTVLPSIGDMASVMNKSLDQAVEAIADAQTGEVERLKEFGITKNMIVAQAAKLRLGMVVNNKNQIVDQQKFNAALFDLMRQRFKGGTELQSKTWKGVMSTITGVWQTSLAQMAGVATDGTIKQRGFFDVLTKNASKLSDTLTKLSGSGKLEKVSQGLGIAMTKAINFSGAVIKNWPKIKPIIVALTAAYVVNRAALIGMTGAMKIGTVISTLSNAYTTMAAAILYYRDGVKLATIAEMVFKKGTIMAAVAQKLLNGTLLTSPITWWIAGIAAAGVGVYFLIKNWDKFKTFAIKMWDNVKLAFFNSLNYIWKLFDNQHIQAFLIAFIPFIGLPVVIIKNWTVIKGFFSGLWGGIKQGASGLGNFFKGIFGGVVGIFKGYINTWIRLVNFLITGINKIKVNIPKGVPGIGGKKFGFHIAKIPMLAKGTSYFQGGTAIVGEKGPEMVNLPRGSRVLSNRRTQSLLNDSVQKLYIGRKPVFQNTLEFPKIPEFPKLLKLSVMRNLTLDSVSNIKSRAGGLKLASEKGPIDRIETLLSGFKVSTTPIIINQTNHITIQGNADEKVVKNVKKALDQSSRDFEREMDAWTERRRRLSFAVR